MGSICKYCGDAIGSGNICVRCGASFPATKQKNNVFSGGRGNAYPNSHLSSLSSDIDDIYQNYKNEHARLKQQSREYFKERDRQREEYIATKKAQKAAIEAQKAQKKAQAKKSVVKNTNAKSSSNENSNNSEKSNDEIFGRLGSGIVFGIIGAIISPNLFIVGFIIGLIVYKG